MTLWELSRALAGSMTVINLSVGSCRWCSWEQIIVIVVCQYLVNINCRKTLGMCDQELITPAVER